MPASSLGSVAGTSDLARQIQEMLVKQGSLQPGQQVRLRLPPGVTLQNLGLPSPSQSPGHSTPSPGQQCVVTAGQCVVGSGQPVGSFGQSLTPVVSSGSLLAGNSASVTNQGSERNRADAELETSDGKAVKQSAANEEQSRFRLPPQLDGASDENSMDASSSDATSSSVIATADNNSVNVVATDHATVIGSLHCADVASAGDSRHLDERCLVQVCCLIQAL